MFNLYLLQLSHKKLLRSALVLLFIYYLACVCPQSYLFKSEHVDEYGSRWPRWLKNTQVDQLEKRNPAEHRNMRFLQIVGIT